MKRLATIVIASLAIIFAAKFLLGKTISYTYAERAAAEQKRQAAAQAVAVPAPAASAVEARPSVTMPANAQPLPVSSDAGVTAGR